MDFDDLIGFIIAIVVSLLVGGASDLLKKFTSKSKKSSVPERPREPEKFTPRTSPKPIIIAAPTPAMPDEGIPAVFTSENEPEKTEIQHKTLNTRKRRLRNILVFGDVLNKRQF